MSTQNSQARNASGEWRPPHRVTLPPIYAWPPSPGAVGKWLFGAPGFLWPMNTITFSITLVTWYALTPSLDAMKSFEAWWIGWLLARNLALVLAVFGGLHVYLYVLKGQGDELKFSTKPLAKNNKRFLFSDQVRDNMFRSVSAGVPIITAYEALTYWLFANGYIGLGAWAAGPVAFWVWFIALLLLAPAIHAMHFYLIHRLLHWRALYKTVHRVHHLNIEVGPWSGLSMHPVEIAMYFSTICVQWLLALHPVNALYQLHIAIMNAAVSHTGFDKLIVAGKPIIDSNNYFHYLHHRYFECNYGSTLAPMDQLFGTFHDGSDEAQQAMRARMQERLKG